MSPFPKPTAFFGPQKRYMRTADWPWPYNIHLQLHDMQPGDYWNDAHGVLLQQKRILTPTGAPGNFKLGANPWFFQYQHAPGYVNLNVQWFVIPHRTFILWPLHLIHRFAYNQIQSPDGVFAYGGYATMSWEAL